MKIVCLSSRRGKSLTLTLNTWAKVALSLCVLGVPFGIGMLIGAKSSLSDIAVQDALANLQDKLDVQKEATRLSELDISRKIEAYSKKLAEIQARAVRMDALGERIIDVSGLDKGEFDFSHSPGLGGPAEEDFLDPSGLLDNQQQPGGINGSMNDDTESARGTFSTGLQDLFTELEMRMDDREQQFDLLQVMLADNDLKRESTLAGRPISKGWMSSRFGKRIDPFNGRVAWHKGVDFAGREGSEVIAVAAGIVLRSERYKGYGLMVEIDHGDGFVTRYGHNKTNLVAPGDLVKKGESLAKMGSTGRSTGPHVHFEVYKNGRNVDPASYIRRTVR